MAAGLYTITSPTLVEQRVLAQQGFGVALATRIFLSQVSMALPVFGSVSQFLSPGDGECGPLIAAQDTDVGSAAGWSPATEASPGYGEVYFDAACAVPWVNATFTDWTGTSDFNGGPNIGLASDETAIYTKISVGTKTA